MAVKDIIRNRRLELGFTMKEVADMVGVSEGTISRWESGHIANMRRDKIVALAKVLQISPSTIMEWTDSENLEGVQINEHHTEYYIDAETRKLAQELHDNPELSVMLDAIKTLSPQDAKLVMDMVRRMQNERHDRT